ncbi:hypothetical protein QF028_003449 [Neobacillus sp. B4I6]|jgi:hypothetical protein
MKRNIRQLIEKMTLEEKASLCSGLNNKLNDVLDNV